MVVVSVANSPVDAMRCKCVFNRNSDATTFDVVDGETTLLSAFSIAQLGFDTSGVEGFVVDTAPDDLPAMILDALLFVGSFDAATNPSLPSSITHVLNVGFLAAESRNAFELQYLHVPLLDESETDLEEV